MAKRSVFVAAVGGLWMGGCGALTPPPTARSVVTADQKVVQVTAETTTRAELKPDLEMMVSLRSFAVKRSTCPTAIKDLSSFGLSQWEVVNQPQFKITPNRIVFDVTAKNRLGHVIHLDPKLIRIKVNDDVYARETVAEGTRRLLAPDDTEKFSVDGPLRAELPMGSSTVELTFFDLVTAVDSAGETTERSHYKWTFAVNKRERTIQHELKVTVRELGPKGLPKCD